MKTKILLLALIINRISYSQKATVSVTVLDMNNKPYIGDKIYFVSQKGKLALSGITNNLGMFKIDLPEGNIFDIKIHSIGEELEYNSLEIPTLENGETYVTTELLIKYELPKSYSFNNLQFESGKADLKKESLNELDNLIEFMKLKPGMKIEIQGHTDSDGNELDNFTLSQKRADAVKAYLITKGIQGTRMQAKGYGENNPIADNSSSAGKQMNRRTEIVIK